MTLLESWVHTALARSLGWALVHSLWQGVLIAALLAAVLCVTRSSRIRYGAACVAMLLTLASFGVTVIRLMPAPLDIAVASRHWPPPAGVALPILSAEAPSAPPGFAAWLPWMAPFWAAGVLIFHLRALGGWAAARRLRRSGVCRAPAEWQRRLDVLAARLRVSRPALLLESCLAEAPVVMGHLRPVILMPVGLLAGLPVAQVEAILMHELAHIRRQDYLVNLMQTFVEGLLFYHPAVWWISGVIRAERENCCDDLAVLATGDARQYAAALAALEQNRWTAQQPALAATGGSLVKRIRRLLQQPERPRAAWTPVISAGILFAGATNCVRQLANTDGAEVATGAGSWRVAGEDCSCCSRTARRAIEKTGSGTARSGAANCSRSAELAIGRAAAQGYTLAGNGCEPGTQESIQEVVKRRRGLHHYGRRAEGLQSAHHG